MAKIIVNNPRQVINGGAKKYYFKVKGLGGPKGDKGDKGDTGATGPQGPQGNAATVSIGSTTTLPVGYDATVTNSGSIYNAVLNFGIPQGPRGPQGATGAKGDKGDKGDQGNPGPQGEKGTNATVYVGTTSTLNPGSQATVYNSGTDSNAVLNFGIPKGEKGDTGPMPTIAQSTGQAIDQVMSQKATTDALNTKQATITSSNKLSADLVTDTSTTNKFVTASDITNWNAKQDALTAGTGIDITSGIISTPAIVPEVVTELPTTGAEGRLYLTPKAHTTSTATGNPIEATITAQAGQLESFQLDGDTFQQSYTGKNLWSNTPYKVGYYIASDGREVADNDTCIYGNIETSPNTTYTLTLTNLGVGANVRAHAYDENGNWIGQIGVLFIATDEKKSRTFTTPANAKYLRWSFWEKSKIADGQIEKGSTATDYEPYVGGQPSPSPDYPQQIQTVTGEQTVTVVGKNLLKLNDGATTLGDVPITTTNGTVNLNGTATSGAQGYYVTIGITASEPMVFSTNKSGATSGLDIKLQYKRNGTIYYQSVGSSVSLQAGDIIQQMYLMITNGSALDCSFSPMLEKGSTKTSFEPYAKHDYHISLGSIELCDIGGYQDYIHKVGEDWIITKRTASVLLNEDSSIYRANFGSNPFYTPLPQSSGGADDAVNVVSDYFYGVTYYDRTLEIPNSIFNTYLNNSPILYIRNTPWATIEDFKSWLSEHNVKVYVKTFPTDTVITDTTLIAQLEAIRTASLQNGTNTITNTATGSNLAGDMEIGYYGFNPTNRYDKFIWLDLNNNYEQIGGE